MARSYYQDYTAYFKNHVKNEEQQKSLKSERQSRRFNKQVKTNKYVPDPPKNKIRTGNGIWVGLTGNYKTIYHPDYSVRGVSFTEQDKPITKQQQEFKNKSMQLKHVLEQKFIYVDEVAEILELGFTAKKNVFLYGRGGHAKSEILQEFLKYVDPSGEDCFVQACGEGLSEEKLFGGLDLQKFQKTGEIEYLVQNSFMNHKYVVFEELLDSRMNVLLSLKDILTSGIFRQGKQQFKIKTEFIVCLTNRTKQEVAEDNSIKALMERFPLEMKVEWPKYEKEDYVEMFRKVLKHDLIDVATICAKINETGDFVSPRTAIHMGQVYLSSNDLVHLKYFGATTDIIDKIEKAKKENEQLNLISKFVHEVDTLSAISLNDVNSCKSTIKELRRVMDTMEQYTYTDRAFNNYSTLKQRTEKLIENSRQCMLQLVENE